MKLDSICWSADFCFKRIGCLLSLLALPLGASLAQSAGSTNTVLREVVDIPMPARRTALSRIAPGSESLRALGRHRCVGDGIGRPKGMHRKTLKPLRTGTTDWPDE